MVMDKTFWKGKKVFVTGHTGFKGSWLTFWLNRLEANVVGYSLRPNTQPALFSILELQSTVKSFYEDVRDFENLHLVLNDFQPEIIFHLAAQALVIDSYLDPVNTFSTNILGTVNLLQISKELNSLKSIVVVTTDKCYENDESKISFNELDKLGGSDPYSSSKGCSELITHAYRQSFYSSRCKSLASARAGNVIGGGDWNPFRLVPDVVKAFSAGEVAKVRNPRSVRPWQHVLEPLSGYLVLAERLFGSTTNEYSSAWNFGPKTESCISVGGLCDLLATKWGAGRWQYVESNLPSEARVLRLDITKAETELNWEPVWNLEKTVKATVSWYKHYSSGLDVREVCESQIDDYMRDAALRAL